MSLNPYNLTPAASLNRVRLVSSPRLKLPAHLEGRTAHEVLSAAAVQGLLEATAAKRGLSMEHWGHITDMLQTWRTSPQEDPREAAEAVIAEHGRRLASLIAVLKLGEPAARAARPEWDDTYWRHWAAIERVFLAGGLATPELALRTSRHLAGLGVACEVLVAPHAQFAPLVGAARLLDPRNDTAFVFDFGGTTVKRGIATRSAGRLTALQVLQPLPSPRSDGDRSVGALAAIVADTLRSHGLSLHPAEICISIASYMRDNQPLEPPQAAYVDLSGIDNLGAWLANRLWVDLRVPVTVCLIHDGTASALGVSPSRRTAVITTGTHLGVGFAREDTKGLAPFATGFELIGPG